MNKIDPNVKHTVHPYKYPFPNFINKFKNLYISLWSTKLQVKGSPGISKMLNNQMHSVISEVKIPKEFTHSNFTFQASKIIPAIQNKKNF